MRHVSYTVTLAACCVVLLSGIGSAACGSAATSGFGHGDGGGGGGGAEGGGVQPGTDGGIHLGADGGDSGKDTGGGTGGPHVCDVSCTAAGGTCSMGNCTLNENPGGVTPGDQNSLKGGGTADPAFKWLYPYDQTIFPRGLIPPTLQMGGTGADATWVHIQFPGMTYNGFFGASSPVQVKLPAASWTAITEAAGALEPVNVSITKISGGMVTGPANETWQVAQGNLRGTIYYETYDSAIIGGAGGIGIMQIQPGATTPTVVKKGCGNVCHTASADGSTLVANAGSLIDYLVSSSYDLKTSASTIFAAKNDIFTYCGLYPDGSFCMSATDYRTWIAAPSKLWNTATGANIPATGWDGVITKAGTVAFSPNGELIAFNHEDTGGGHTLAMMSFDKSTYTFSGLEDIATDPANTLAWPAFTPDETTVAYHAGSSSAFETDEGNTGDVYVVDLASKTTHRADTLDGYTGSGSASYLPDNDTNLSFAPTILPEAVGGYFWVVFTSHRSYGNILPSMASAGGEADEAGKLWVAAMDIGAKPGTDPTHPAFYLDGQESSADNLRGFWVRSPCQNNGSTCSAGDECCEGFCRQVGSTYQCVSPPSGCSMEYEACTSASDCCDTSDLCIGGFCAEPPPK
jgi:hypothetical protein